MDHLNQTPSGPDLRVTIGSLSLVNPVMTASGTFGYAQEFETLMDLRRPSDRCSQSFPFFKFIQLHDDGLCAQFGTGPFKCLNQRLEELDTCEIIGSPAFLWRILLCGFPVL